MLKVADSEVVVERAHRIGVPLKNFGECDLVVTELTFRIKSGVIVYTVPYRFEHERPVIKAGETRMLDVLTTDLERQLATGELVVTHVDMHSVPLLDEDTPQDVVEKGLAREEIGRS